MHQAVRRVLASKYFLIPAGVLLFYSIVGFLILPLVVRWYVPKFVHEQLRCRAAIEKVRINPFLLSFEASQFSLAGPEGELMVGFEKMFLDLELTGLLSLAAKFREIRIEKPTVHVVFQEDGSINFAKLAPRSKEPKPEADSGSKAVKLILQSASIRGGKVSITDRRQNNPETVSFSDLDFDLKALSTIRDRNGDCSLSARTQNGETLHWEGEITLVPFRSRGKLSCLNIQIATLLGFLRDRLNLESPDGAIDLDTDYSVEAGEGAPQLLLENLRMGLSRLALKLPDTEHPFLEVGSIELDSGRVDLSTKTLNVGKLLIDGSTLRLRVDESGRDNLQQIIRKAATHEKVEEASTPGDMAAQESRPDSPPWTIHAEVVEIKEAAFDMEDLSRVLPLTIGISDIAFKSRTTVQTGSKAQVMLDQLSTELRGVRVGSKGSQKALFDLKGLTLEGGEIDLASRSIGVARIGLSDGRIDIHRDHDGRFNFERLFAGKDGAAEPASKAVAAESSPWTGSIGAVQIKDIAFGLEDLSSSKPFSAAVSSISADSKVKMILGPKTDVIVKELSTHLKGLRLGAKDETESLFEAQRFDLEGGDVELGDRAVKIGRIALQDGHIDVRRERNGTINLLSLFSSRNEGNTAGSATDSARAADAPWKYSLKNFEISGFHSVLSDDVVSPDKPLFKFKDFTLRAADVDGRSPAAVEVSFGVEPGGRATIKGKVDPSGPSMEAKVNVAGWVLTPLQPYLEPFITLTLESAALTTDGVFRYGVPNAGSKLGYEGSFSLDRLSLKQTDGKEPYLGIGAMQMPKLKLALEPDSLDIDEIKLSKPFGQLLIAEDGTVNLAKIVKEKQPEKTVPDPSGASTKADLKKSPPSPQKSGKGAGDSFPFKIGKVRVEEGNMVFADMSLRPKFMTRIHGLKGTVSGLSSAANAPAQIQLDGSVDQYGMAKVRGELDLYDFKRSSDIEIIFKNLEMTSITPYSGKFAGRKIKSGKLSMNLKYRIQDNQMVGDNKIIVDNLELGEHVQSASAVNLPLDLAVALLKDSNGRIDLGLPVSGDLNDPKFSLGPLIWKALSGVIIKAATAPFHALGSLFGGSSENIDSVVFEAGKSELEPPEKEKLKKISDALHNRPQLKLVVQGLYSPETDGDELKQSSLQRAIATRLGQKIPAGEDPGPPDLSDSKVRRVLEKIFAERFGNPALEEIDRGIKQGTIKPVIAETADSGRSDTKKQGRISRILQGVKIYKLIPGAKSPEQSELLATELYARLSDSEPLADKDLLQLAANRAQSVNAELQQACGIPAERIVSKDPESVADQGGAAARLNLEAMAASPSL